MDNAYNKTNRLLHVCVLRTELVDVENEVTRAIGVRFDVSFFYSPMLHHKLQMILKSIDSSMNYI